ncbi:MAG: hypothetical protein WCI37_01355 [bacterium]
MQDLLVLGIIPYTNIILTFNEYVILIVMVSVIAILILRKTNNFFKLRLFFGLLIMLARKDIISKNLPA